MTARWLRLLQMYVYTATIATIYVKSMDNGNTDYCYYDEDEFTTELLQVS